MMEHEMETKHIGLIEQGTVIDHITDEKVFAISELLKLDNVKTFVFVGAHLISKKLNKKGLIKIENYFLSDDMIHKIALLTPEATINLIKDGKVFEKKKLVLPEMFIGIIKCNNYNCITNKEQVDTKIHVVNKMKRMFKCYHCENIMNNGEVQLVK